MIYTGMFRDAYLSHHGVKGMKWGVWNAETQAKYGLESAMNKLSSLSSGGGGGGIIDENQENSEGEETEEGHLVKDLQDTIAARIAEEKAKLAEQNNAESKEEHDARVQSLAYEVIRGDWGNGQERYDRLLDSGHSYSEVQTKVNDIIYGTNDYEAGNNTSGREDDRR